VKATATQVHGVLVVVQGVGLLLRGESGTGKSNCALELIRRGHRLVADDVVEIRHDPTRQRLVGSPPSPIAGRLEVQDVDIVDVSALFGTGAFAPSHQVDAIIDLMAAAPGNARQRRVDPPPQTHLLGHGLPTYIVQNDDVTTMANRLEVIARILGAAPTNPQGA
jgi:HPr kinase/phosphorylase